MSESIVSHPVVRRILDQVTGESTAALRNSGAGRMLQPPELGGFGLTADEFVWAVCELAAVDGSLGWLAATYNAAAHAVAGLPPAAHQVWDANPRALITIGHRGAGDLVGGRLTGRWESVVGAERADWLLLSVGPTCRVLVPRSRVRVELADRPAGLGAAGVCEVVVDDLAVDDGCVFSGDRDTGVVAGAGAAAAVVGSADGVWRTHVDQVRARLDISYGGDEVTDEAAAEVARAASDIDAAKLQITGALDQPAAWAFAQSVARARSAADRLLASSRHALDASDPVTNRWRDVHSGCRLAVRILDGPLASS
jgi:3-hydroxy-9,10-secoandrosta-1,3,5(10)-triene-9,17-dione monooxygenase